MASNKIELYQGNSKLIVCDVSGLVDLVGYTGTLSVKKHIDSTSTLLVKNGTISGLQISVDLTYVDTSINPGTYLYDITIDNSTNRYTAVQDEFSVLESVKF